MHVGGGRVARLAGVDDDHGAALAGELKRGGESGGRSADDGDVAVPLEGGVRCSSCVDDTFTPELQVTLRYSQEAERRERRAAANNIEQVVRTRLRSLRTTLGLSLDELAARTNLSPSTISRIETGKRTISLDILVPLARPSRSTSTRSSTCGATRMWSSARRRALRRAHNLDLEPTDRPHDRHQDAARTDPQGGGPTGPSRSRLVLRDRGTGAPIARRREITVETGQAAEFATMTPHASPPSAAPPTSS